LIAILGNSNDSYGVAIELATISEKNLMNSRQKIQGFTLVELLVTVTLVGIIAAYAVPAFQDTIARSKVTATANSLAGALNYARGEAIDSGQQIAVRPKTSGTDGWEIVQDPTGTPVIIKEFQLTSSTVTISTSLTDVTYEPTGFRTAGSVQDDLLIEDSSTSTSRRVCVSLSGSVRVIKTGVCPP